MVARVLVPWLPSWRNRIPSQRRATIKAINAAPTPTSTTLAPTDHLASCLTSRLRLMRMGRNSLRPYALPFLLLALI